MRTLLASALVTLVACQPKTQRPLQKPEVQDVPRWRTEKNEVRLEIIAKLLEGGDSSRALHLIKDMRDEKIDRPELDLYQGTALHMHGMSDDALRLLERAADALPKSAGVQRALCVVHADEGRRDQALLACEKATQLDPGDGAAWNNYGFLLLGYGDPDEARQALERAVDIDATSARYRNNLAFAQAASGDTKNALRTFLTTGTPADAHYNVGTALERLGDVDRASSYYRRALTYDPKHLYAEDALARLRAEAPTPSGDKPTEEMYTP